MSRVGEMSIKLTADKASFDRDMRMAQQRLRGYTKDAKAANDGTHRLGRGMAGVGKGVTTLNSPISGLTGNLGNLTGQLSSVGSRAGAVGIAIGALTAVTVGAVVAAHNLATANAQQAKELQSMATKANVSTKEIQSWIYATDKYNLSADKASDILKDLNDKTGDFIATGGGEMKDFFEKVGNKVGLTAHELSKLAGPDALVAVMNAMEKANVPANEQIFYLESIADEASALRPLLADNGTELKKITERWETLNSAMTDSEMSRLSEYTRNVDELSYSWDSLTRTAVMPFVDELGIAAKSLAEIFGTARRNLLINNIHESTVEMHELNAEIKTLQERIDTGPKYGGASFWEALWGENTSQSSRKESLKELITERDKIRNQLIKDREDLDQMNGKPSEQDSQQEEQRQKAAEKRKQEWEAEQKKAEEKKAADKKAREEQQAADSLKRQQQSSAAFLANLDSAYADERGKLSLAHEKKLMQIASLNLGEQEVQRRGFESIEALRTEYAAREREHHAQAIAEFNQQEQERLNQEAQRAQENLNRRLAPFREETEALQREVNRRSQILAAGDDATRLQAEFELEDKQRRLAEQYDIARQAAAEDKALQLQLEQDHHRATELLEQQHQQNLTVIANEEEANRQKLQAQGYQALLGVVSSYYDGMEGKKAAYTRSAISLMGILLDEEKQAAVQSIWTNTYDTAMKAYNAMASIPIVGPALGVGAAGAVIAAGTAYTAQVTGLAGMAHDGMDYIPREGTWLLDEGERVVDKRTNADLKNYLANGGGSPVEVHYRPEIHIHGSNNDDMIAVADRAAEVGYQKVLEDVANNGPIMQRIQS